MFLLSFYCCIGFTFCSDLGFEIINMLNENLEENTEIDKMYLKYKNSGLYVLESTEQEFFLENIFQIRNIIENCKGLIDCDFSIIDREIPLKKCNCMSLDTFQFLYDIKETIANNSYFKIDDIGQLSSWNKCNIFIFNKNAFADVLDAKIKFDFQYGLINSVIKNKIFTLTNMEIDEDFIMFIYLILKEYNNHRSNFKTSSVVSFIILNFKNSAEKSDFTKNFAVQFDKREYEPSYGIFYNIGIFGEFIYQEKKYNKKDCFYGPKFAIKSLFRMPKSSMDIKSICTIQSNIAFVQLEEEKRDHLVSKRLYCQISRYYTNTINLGSQFFKDRPKAVGYRIKYNIDRGCCHSQRFFIFEVYDIQYTQKNEKFEGMMIKNFYFESPRNRYYINNFILNFGLKKSNTNLGNIISEDLTENTKLSEIVIPDVQESLILFKPLMKRKFLREQSSNVISASGLREIFLSDEMAINIYKMFLISTSPGINFRNGECISNIDLYWCISHMNRN